MSGTGRTRPDRCLPWPLCVWFVNLSPPHPQGMAVAQGVKDLAPRGLSLLRGDVGQAAEVLRDGKRLLQQSREVAAEAKDTIQKAKRRPANEQGMKFV